MLKLGHLSSVLLSQHRDRESLRVSRNKKTLFVSLIALAVGLIIGATPVTALAQEEEGQVSPLPAAAGALDVIMVSARKREETLLSVPVAASVLNRAMLDTYSITDLESVSNMVPQLILNSGGASSGARLFLRGVGSSSDLGFDQTVGIVIDDVFYNRGRWLQQSFMDMERVEVLKGPQALYFGKNTPAGVVAVSTANPGDEFEGYVKVGFEPEAEEWIGEAVVSGPISDTFGARLAVRYSDMRGWMKNIAEERVGADPFGFTIPAPANKYNAEEELTARLTLEWTPTDDLNINFKIQAVDFKNAGQNSMSQKILCEGPNNTPQPIFGVGDPFADCTVDFRLSKSDLPPEVAATALFGDFNEGVAIIEYESYNSSLRIDYDFDNFTLTSVTGWNWYKNKPVDSQDYSAAGILWTGDIGRHEAFTEEIRLLSNFDSSVNFMVGAFYQKTDYDYRRQTRLIPVPADPVTGTLFSWDNTNTQDGESWSIFAEVIWDITPEVELSGGARYTHEKKVSTAVQTFVHPLLTGLLTDEFFADTFKDDDVSPQATLTWRPEDNLTVYAAYKTGFKAGGFSHTAVLVQGTTIDNLTFDSESVEGFEVGLKTTFLDGRLQLDTVAYRYIFDDQQVSAFDAESTSFTIENAAKTKSQGIELNAIFQATEALQLRGNVAYNHTRYTDFLGPCYAGQTQEAGCNQLINPNTGLPTSQDLSGKHPVLSPDWNLTAGFTYDMPISNALGLTIGSDLRYSSGYPLMTENRPGMWQDGYVRLDASVRLYGMDDSWEFAIIGRNLTNEKILLTGTDRPLTGGDPGLPESDPNAGVLADGFAIIQRKREVLFQGTYRF